MLQAKNLTKRFGECVAVADVSVDFSPGQIHAVLGENGAGKSTLMKMLFGLLQPSAGDIFWRGQRARWNSAMDAIAAGLGMVQQHFALVDTLSAIDNIMLGAEVCLPAGRLNRAAAISRLEQLLPTRRLAVPWHEFVANLSVGQKQRVEILKLLFRGSQVLILDEPTAVLAPHEIDEFFSVLSGLRAAGKTIILITHKIQEVMQICDTYCVLRQGRLVGLGPVRATSPEELVERVIGSKALAESPLPRSPARAELVCECERIAVDNGRLKEVSLQVATGEIVGIAGVEGSGQSELVQVLTGMTAFSGSAKVFGSAVAAGGTARLRQQGLGLVPEDRHAQGLWLGESCHTNLAIGLEERFARYGILDQREWKTATTRWAQAFDVRGPSLDAAVSTLSGGNQQKLTFAREITGRSPRFLICHQPTRGVDLGATQFIHRHLLEIRNSGVGVLLISSDLEELLELSDRLYVLFAGRIATMLSRDRMDRNLIGAAMTGVADAPSVV